MEVYRAQELSFAYPNAKVTVLDNVSFAVESGEFVTLCGKTGCGKTTLLRRLKPAVAPHGVSGGSLFFEGRELSELDLREQTQKIGFVAQNPDNMIVTDKVWHELAFGLESLGVSNSEIRARVAETATYFGIHTWFHKKTSELSGGQKQLLNLASVMVMQPTVLLLDEPTSRLDPIAAREFLEAVSRLNREIGTTVIMAEHRLEEALPYSDRLIVMDGGKIVVDTSPSMAGRRLFAMGHNMLQAMPTAVRVCAALSDETECPVSVCEGKVWLEGLAKEREIFPCAEMRSERPRTSSEKITVELDEVWFGYEKNGTDIIRGLSMKVLEGEIFALVGGNGSGKTTALSLMCGRRKPRHGRVRTDGVVGLLPQNPQELFAHKTVSLELFEMTEKRGLSEKAAEYEIAEVAKICELGGLLDRHPYDLSGGEQQRAALAKLLLMKPSVLLLDEPTKGMDAHYKKRFAALLGKLKDMGRTIVMVTHDVEFCAEYADRGGMLFDGALACCGTPRDLFSRNRYYTTAAAIMAKDTVEGAVTAEDIINAFGGDVPKDDNVECKSDSVIAETEVEEAEVKSPRQKRKLSAPRMFFGLLFLALFLLEMHVFGDKLSGGAEFAFQLSSLAILATAIGVLVPKNTDDAVLTEGGTHKRSFWGKRALIAFATAVVVVPLTIAIGVRFFSDRKYYFISLMIILEALLPFCMSFEKRRPKARELIIISVFCAIAVAGRTAFFMLAQFKPSLAVVIVAGACFGGETGFLVGALYAFVSNFYFGQGPWTPWQMLAVGAVGFGAGILFGSGLLKKSRGFLCIYGALSAIVIHGGILNPATVVMSSSAPTLEMIATAYVMGFPYDVLLAASTVFFLWVAAMPMIEKTERVKTKYGLE